MGALISPICSPDASLATATGPAPDCAAPPLLVATPAAGAVVVGAGAATFGVRAPLYELLCVIGGTAGAL